jgi:carbamoyl-phosphate synthase/aspartate carbamoyltransferase/dihydroorotase
MRGAPVYLSVDVGGGKYQTFEGRSFGASLSSASGSRGEVVFQTGMVGYPESLSDPSYHGQILVLTYPLIGNYGVPDAQALDEWGLMRNVESSRVHVRALIVGEYVDTPSHFEARQTLHEYLEEHGVPGVEGIDTRKLTQLIRDHGTLRGVIATAPNMQSHCEEDLRCAPYRVSTPQVQVIDNPAAKHEAPTLVVDCGVKHSQLRMLLERGRRLVVVGIEGDFQSAFAEYGCDRIFISNGPGDPRDCESFIAALRGFMQSRADVPIFGICLGHQLLSLAAGFSVSKLKYGNRGHNLPCQLVGTTRVFQTTQNHGYAVNYVTQEDEEDEELLLVGRKGWKAFFVNINDHSNEGIIHTTQPWMSVQFHPEAKAGPQDTAWLFDVFLGLCDLEAACATVPPVPIKARSKVLVLGSGGLCIGQSGEFDYSGSQAIKAFREEGLTVLLVNPNIATVQTTAAPGFVDRVYFLPVTPEYVEQVIEMERPDCIALSFGGQTAINCGTELKLSGVLDRYGVEVLGTPVEAIITTEDRKAFKQHIQSIGERIPDGGIATTVEDAVAHSTRIGYPVLVRSAFTLGGQGSGFASNEQELLALLQRSFTLSSQVIIDKSFRGWKEIEYEIVRDRYGNCISVCNMENLDPLGVHTGESIVVAPSQTLSDHEYNMLRSTALKTVASLGIVGECNIQYALDPLSKDYYIIEINARLSRSSALASKATGYPLAYVAAKLALGYGLYELKNSITGTTTACSEPSLDYCVVKVPRWDLNKFQRVNPHIGSAMKSVGEGMAISRSFEEALQSALRMTAMSRYGLEPGLVPCTDDELRNPTYRRILAIATGLASGGGYSVDRVHELSGIDRWFLRKIHGIVSVINELRSSSADDYASMAAERKKELLQRTKRLGFSDAAIAHYVLSTELVVRADRLRYHIRPDVKQIDTVAAEFPCKTNYLYFTYATSTYATSSTPTPTLTSSGGPRNQSTTPSSSSSSLTDDSQLCLLTGADLSQSAPPHSKVLVLGSGVYQIGSSVEFDWCAVNCIRELRAMGKRVIMVNCNPETVSTDYDEADVLYFAEISLETVLDIQDLEHASGVIVSVGGQQPNNIAMALHLQNVRIIGTSAESIDSAENRKKFSRMLERGGIDQPEWKELDSVDAALSWSAQRYPVLVRPSYVLSGAAMNVAYSDEDLRKFLGAAVKVAISRDHPVVISRFILNAKELEVDAVARHGVVKLLALSEHVENAGVHSGDATLIYPAQDVTSATREQVERITHYIAHTLCIHGPFNIQFIAKDDQVKVIECNLRVSRSFPFVSKTGRMNMVAAATRLMLEDYDEEANMNGSMPIDRIGVKVPQFSFNRLTGAEILLGVEMQSTGEVACFGRTREAAYIKALIASGLKLPSRGAMVLLSIGGHHNKKELKPSVELLKQLGYRLYGTRNTARYYDIEELLMSSASSVCATSTRRSGASVAGGGAGAGAGAAGGGAGATEQRDSVMGWIAQHKFAMIINVTERNKMRSSLVDDDQLGQTPGYLMRQAAVTNNVTVVTDIKTAKLLVTSLPIYLANAVAPRVDFEIDCFASYNTVRIPGLIDVHVHVREPGETHKEDWDSCTRAAVAGGITMICAMPNTKPSLVGPAEYELCERLASAKAHCDYALFAGASSTNSATVAKELADRCAGLKLYLNNTHGDLVLSDCSIWAEHIKNWTHPKHPICVHAEGRTLAGVLHLANLHRRRIHVCHVSSREEIELIKMSKQLGMQGLLTCEVAPHHLFLTHSNNNGVEFSVKPPLQSHSDTEALWKNLDIIDCFATDHAPHLRHEKTEGCCPGFPGLETALGLLLTAVHQKRLTIEDIVLRYHTNPKRIFDLPDQPDTFVEIDMNQRYTIPATTQMTKAGWTPFAGQECVGAIRRVVFRGQTVCIADQPMRNLWVPGVSSAGKNMRAKTSLPSTESAAVDPRCEHSSTESAAVSKPTKGTAIIPHAIGAVVLATPPITTRVLTKDLLSAKQFTKESLRLIFARADDIRHCMETTGKPPPYASMQGKTLGLFFYEPSTRTRVSFETAMKRLGGNTIHVTAEQSSVRKGETLEDSIVSLRACGQVDAIVLRHPEKGAARRAARVSDVPIINAGDGSGEHPTQTLVDLYTIRRELGSVGGICVVFVGDMKYGRTVHSLVKALALRGDSVRIHYVAPQHLRIPAKIFGYVRDRGVEQQEHNELSDEVLAVADVLYVTRFQTERYAATEEDSVPTTVTPYCITPATLAKTKADVRVLHPLPRGNEISTDIDTDPRAAYRRQMENGHYVRMALLSLLLQ